MASTLDLQEQEQLDQLKAFWNRHGNLLTWLLTLALLAWAGYNGWNWWQRDQAAKAAALHDEIERAAAAGELPRVATAWGDMKERFPRTAYAQQGALAAARVWVEKGQPDAARGALEWAAESASDPAYRAVARVRLAGILTDQGKAEDALAVLDKSRGAGFDALVEDRRGDALTVLNQPEQARAAFKSAYAAVPAELEYRRVIEAKLMALGVDPASIKTDDKNNQKAGEAK